MTLCADILEAETELPTTLNCGHRIGLSVSDRRKRTRW